MSRPTMSVTPPGGNGTTIFTGFVGYCSAKAEPETRSAAKSATMRTIVFIGPLLNRDSPDDPRTGVNIRVFPPSCKTEARFGRLLTNRGLHEERVDLGSIRC